MPMDILAEVDTLDRQTGRAVGEHILPKEKCLWMDSEYTLVAAVEAARTQLLTVLAYEHTEGVKSGSSSTRSVERHIR